MVETGKPFSNNQIMKKPQSPIILNIRIYTTFIREDI